MEGPRGVRPEEIESLHRLSDAVFRASATKKSVMASQYPQLFNAENYDNLRVCVEDGVCVSHVGLKMQDAFLFGCRIQTACIGAVCTHPDFRGRGLASQCCGDAWRKARREGADVMIVSGDRDLYRMRGCLRVGDDRVFTLTSETHVESASSLTVAPLSEGELPLVMDCYRAESVRFQRTESDYRYHLQSGWAMNSPADVWIVRDSGAFRGCIIARNPQGRDASNLIEFSGDRRSILSALPLLIRLYSLKSLSFQVQRHDALLRSLCEGCGLKGAPTSASGTVAVANFPQLMERMRPRFEELAGKRITKRLRFFQNGATYWFALGEEAFATDRDSATRMVFGTIAGTEPVLAGLEGALGEALRTILPLPTLWYGINYV